MTTGFCLVIEFILAIAVIAIININNAKRRKLFPSERKQEGDRLAALKPDRIEAHESSVATS
jgi:hypothetical protein